MSDSRKQKDWFYLKTTNRKAADRARNPNPVPPGATAQAASSSREIARKIDSRPVSGPVNHAQLDPADLPPMREAILDEQQLGILLKDIHEHGQDIRLQHPGRIPDSDRTNSRPADLEQVGRRLQSGELNRIQIRYLWESQHWIDTIQRQQEGFRLVRIMHAAT